MERALYCKKTIFEDLENIATEPSSLQAKAGNLMQELRQGETACQIPTNW